MFLELKIKFSKDLVKKLCTCNDIKIIKWEKAKIDVFLMYILNNQLLRRFLLKNCQG